MKHIAHNVEETHALAESTASQVMARMPDISNAMVLALIGDLGAGKTTFAQAFAKALGVRQNLKSPTFMLMHQHAVPSSDFSLWHLDLYRLENTKDLVNLDLASVFADPRNIVLVEWPDKALSIFPKEHVEIRLTHEGSDKRGLTIKWPPSLR